MINENTKKELANVFKQAIGHRSITQFVKECGMVDESLIVDILNEKINVLPDRRLFRDIEKASQRRVTYSYLCQICGYPEYDCEDDTWKNYYPQRGSIYMVDLGFSNLDSEQNGIRPCLIISNNIGNKNSCIISVAPLTSKKKRPMPTHVELTRADGVKQDSLISIEQTKVVSKRRLFYNRVPIKVVDLSEEKIAEVNTAIEKQFGLIDCLFNEDVAFELVEQIKVLEQNKKIKQSKGLIDILDSKIQELINYCKKYHRNINTVVRDYEKNQRYAC